MIKAVIFDYGGTLVRANVNYDVAFEKSVERLLIEGIEVRKTDFHNAFMDTVEWRRSVNSTGREVDGHEFFSHLLSIFGHEVDRDITDEFGMHIYESAEPKLLGDIEKLLVTLSEE